ncbi:DNA polymerase Y family protein [Luteolibacter arcticus]|uniref:DNA polymerase Y family protein n=1 Tax=Luteolibacter arcticus TaxID=1581411 RepID=A0ABT3GEV7_9BACT|nr:DNA polymerase Y family protein [Luteolibacter arcticus]MCW1921845.1 DNA polymerase Y family protein [Luteolibacter arcticus]
MFAALHLPDLTVMAALRACPDARGKPCAVLEADVDPEAVLEKIKLCLQAVNEIARSAGVAPGWPLNRALVRCPDLKVLTPDPAGEAELLRQMIAAAEGITPDLEIAGKDTLLLDLSRTSSRHAARLGELEVADVWPAHARAATPDLARLAVRHESCHGRTVTPREMGRLPLGLLGYLPEGGTFLSLLNDWGLATLGDFMNLPRQQLTARLGPQAGGWHDLLHGKTCRLLRLHRPPESLEQTMDFEEPVTSTEPLVFAFKRLLHALSARLAARHVAVKTLKIVFHLERGAAVHREIRLPEPRVEEGELLRLIQVLLDSLKTGGNMTGLTLDVETTLPTAAQRDWFIRQLPQPERWSDTLAQLEALLGPGKVGIPVPPASHRPDDFRLLPAEGNTASSSGGCQPANSLPLRRLRPAAPVMVAADADPRQPRPLALLTGPYKGQVMEVRGPFRHSGHWWDPQSTWQRIEWDVRLAGDQLVRLAFTPPDLWLIDGFYQ